MKFSGWKSYTVGGAMIALGILMLWGEPSATYADPYGDVTKAVHDIVGVILICQGTGIITLRQAISKISTDIARKYVTRF